MLESPPAPTRGTIFSSVLATSGYIAQGLLLLLAFAYDPSASPRNFTSSALHSPNTTLVVATIVGLLTLFASAQGLRNWLPRPGVSVSLAALVAYAYCPNGPEAFFPLMGALAIAIACEILVDKCSSCLISSPEEKPTVQQKAVAGGVSEWITTALALLLVTVCYSSPFLNTTRTYDTFMILFNIYCFVAGAISIDIRNLPKPSRGKYIIAWFTFVVLSFSAYSLSPYYFNKQWIKRLTIFQFSAAFLVGHHARLGLERAIRYKNDEMDLS